MRQPSSTRCGPFLRAALAWLVACVLAPGPTLAAPGDVLFQDTFATFANWTEAAAGGDADVGAQTFNSSPRSMFLRYGEVTATSVAVNAAGVGGLEVAFWFRRGADGFSEGPDNNEDLVFEFLDATNTWRELDRFLGSGTPGQILTPSYVLPPEALHAGLRFRFRLTAGSGSPYDWYHIDDFRVTETGATAALALGTCENFSGSLANWAIDASGGGNAGISAATANSPSRSLYLRWDPVTVTSVPIDLSGAGIAALEVSVWVRRGDDAFSEDLDSGENLVVEYLNPANVWVALETFAGGGTDGQVFNRTYTIAAAALHAGFRLRLRMTNGSGPDFDYWHVDDICLADAGALPTRIDLRFNETAWPVAGAVLDSTPNLFHGTATTAAPIPGKVCNAANFAANSNTDRIALPGVAADALDDFSLMFWMRTSSTVNQVFFSAANGTRFNEMTVFLVNSGQRIRFDFRNNTVLETDVGNVADGVWRHYAWTRDGDDHCLYVNGVLEDCDEGGSTQASSVATNGLYLGQDQDALGGGFNANDDAQGVVDELLLIDRQATAAEIAQIVANNNAGLAWDGSPVSCPGDLDHFAVDVGGATASTCRALEVTITALDQADNVITDYDGTVDITTSNGVTGHGDWSKLDHAGAPSADPAQGALVAGPNDSGSATLTFVPGGGAGQDGGSVKIFLTNQHAEDLQIDVVDPTVPLSLTNSDTVSFGNNAFEIVTVDPLGDLPVAGRPHQLRIDMVRKDLVTGICAVATNYNVPTVKAWITRDPGDPAGAAPALQTATETEALPNADPGTANLTLPFVAGTANVTLLTTDVGKYVIELLDDSFAFSDTAIDDVSPTFTVRPFGIAFTDVNAGGTPNPATTSPAGGAFTAAGSDFAATLGAYRWSAGDDVNGDGVPDAGANITDNGLTPAFRADTPIVHAALAPDAGQIAAANGEFPALQNAAVAAGAWSAGQATAAALRYSEVGAIEFSTSVSAYLGTPGANVTGSSRYDGSSGAIGRFRAHRFEVYDALVDTEPVPEAACDGAFSYVDQPIAFANPPTVTLRARGADDALLDNYHDFTGVGGANWWRLDLATGVTETVTDAAAVSPIALTDSIVHAPTSGSGTNGELQLALSGTLTYADRDATPYGPVAPFNATPRLDVTATDPDGATGTKSFNPMTLAAPELRWGRLAIENAYGSELLPAVVPLRTEYWDGTSFVTAADDACTTLALATDLELANPETAGGAAQPGTAAMTLGAGATTITSGDASVAAGQAGLTFSAPGAGNTGYVDVLPRLGTALPWLRYDWEDADGAGDGPHDGDPAGRVTFGINPGRAPVIYTREPWN